MLATYHAPWPVIAIGLLLGPGLIVVGLALSIWDHYRRKRG